MFQVTTLDLSNPPLTDDGKIDYSKDFFGKETNLTVSGQLNGETYAMASATSTHSVRRSVPRIPTRRAMPPSSG